jgi:hypothetical protein
MCSRGTALPCLNQPFHSHAWQEANRWSSSGASLMAIAVSRPIGQAGPPRMTMTPDATRTGGRSR